MIHPLDSQNRHKTDGKYTNEKQSVRAVTKMKGVIQSLKLSLAFQGIIKLNVQKTLQDLGVNQ